MHQRTSRLKVFFVGLEGLVTEHGGFAIGACRSGMLRACLAHSL
jgi:hypothetical protein